jgi:hypothetical protein
VLFRNFDELGVQARDDRLWHAGRRNDAIPRGRFESRQARFEWSARRAPPASASGGRGGLGSKRTPAGLKTSPLLTRANQHRLPGVHIVCGVRALCEADLPTEARLHLT